MLYDPKHASYSRFPRCHFARSFGHTLQTIRRILAFYIHTKLLLHKKTVLFTLEFLASSDSRAMSVNAYSHCFLVRQGVLYTSSKSLNHWRLQHYYTPNYSPRMVYSCYYHQKRYSVQAIRQYHFGVGFIVRVGGQVRAGSGN